MIWGYSEYNIGTIKFKRSGPYDDVKSENVMFLFYFLSIK